MPLPALAALPFALKALLGLGGVAGAGAIGARALGGPGAGKEFLTGKEGQIGTYDLFNPEQKAGMSSILQSGLGQLGQFKPVDFDPIAKQAREQFSQETVPGIAERFTGMGAGSQSSSAFPQIMGQAGAGLESNLAAQKSQFGLQQQGQQQQMLMALLGLGMQPQFSSYYQPGNQGLLGSLGGGGLGSLMGMFK